MQIYLESTIALMMAKGLNKEVQEILANSKVREINDIRYVVLNEEICE